MIFAIVRSLNTEAVNHAREVGVTFMMTVPSWYQEFPDAPAWEPG